MKEKSSGQVLSVQQEDPSTTHGMTEVLKSINPYVSVLSPCGNVRRKMVVNGKAF